MPELPQISHYNKGTLVLQVLIKQNQSPHNGAHNNNSAHNQSPHNGAHNQSVHNNNGTAHTSCTTIDVENTTPNHATNIPYVSEANRPPLTDRYRVRSPARLASRLTRFMGNRLT